MQTEVAFFQSLAISLDSVGCDTTLHSSSVVSRCWFNLRDLISSSLVYFGIL